MKTGLILSKIQSNLDLSSFKYHNLALDNRTLPEKNVDMTFSYINWLSERPYIAGDIDKMLAAYNWGSRRFRNWFKKHGDKWFEKIPPEKKEVLGLKSMSQILKNVQV